MVKKHLLEQIILGTWLVGGIFACAAPNPIPPAPTITLSNPAATLQPSPTPCPKVATVPQIGWLETCPEFDPPGNLIGARYRNLAGIHIASFDAADKFHNHQVTWHWDRMTPQEKDGALRWLFDPHQMRYVNFEDRESWLIESITQWIPRFTDFTLATDAAVAAHWQSDGPPLNQQSLYEALSRIKTIALIPERRTCNYGYSHLGLVEFGGETILFTAPGWQKVSQASREIFMTVWTIKEAMVIYYPQVLGWSSACPNERDYVKNENYSTLWLIQAMTTLARIVPQDGWYWEDSAIALQLRVIKTQTFPACAAPQYLPAPQPTREPCLPLP